MNRLDHQDLGTLLSAVDRLHSDFAPQTLPQRVLAAASDIVGADSVTFTGFRYDGSTADLVWDSGEGYSPDEIDVFRSLMHEHPMYRAYMSDGRKETLKIIDMIPERRFARTALYNEFYRREGVSNKLVTPVPVSNEMFVTCSINIKDRDFSERDKMILDLMSPHFTSAIANAFAYARVSGALETDGCSIVALSSEGKPAFVSDFGLQLFKKYFPDEKCGERLFPVTLRVWIDGSKLAAGAKGFKRPTSIMKISRDDGEMTALLSTSELTREQILILEEKRPAVQNVPKGPALTPRELEVLSLITHGKSDPAMARLLGVSLRTVHKHVENIYQKLGVETRTAAMLRAFELMPKEASRGIE